MPAASPPDYAGPAAGDPAGTIDDLRSALLHHRPVDEREAAARVTFLAALDELADPFDAEREPTHVTASAIVIGPAGVVLHRHRRLHRWMQPGGHIDPGETPAGAALRESVEETGLALHHPDGGPRLIHVDVHAAANDHVHLDLRYLLLSPGGEPEPAPGESPDVGWFSWEEAESMADEALAGGLRAARGQPEAAGTGGARGAGTGGARGAGTGDTSGDGTVGGAGARGRDEGSIRG